MALLQQHPGASCACQLAAVRLLLTVGFCCVAGVQEAVPAVAVGVWAAAAAPVGPPPAAAEARLAPTGRHRAAASVASVAVGVAGC